MSYGAVGLIFAPAVATIAPELFLASNEVNGVNNIVMYVKEWLGEDAKAIRNKAQDDIFMSKDGLRKIRFDIRNSQGDLPHIHLEEFINGKWRDAIPGTHRIYPK